MKRLIFLIQYKIKNYNGYEVIKLDHKYFFKEKNSYISLKIVHYWQILKILIYEK